jgi:cyclopropane fatty-acyl-phospholipid synthase-like methyltransferase
MLFKYRLGVEMQQPLTLRTTAAAHAEIPYANPLSVRDVETLLREVASRSPATALDIGCGPGGICVQLAMLCQAEICAVDINPDFLQRAIAFARSAGVESRIRFAESSAEEIPLAKYDLVICIGSSHAFGGPTDALAWCRSRLAERGAILFADLMWSSAPPAEFVQFLDVTPEYYWCRDDEEQIFFASGLKITKRVSAAAEDWRRYEDAVYAGRRDYAATLDAKECAAVLSRAEAWKCAFDTMGCQCLGFTAYIAVAS